MGRRFYHIDDLRKAIGAPVDAFGCPFEGRQWVSDDLGKRIHASHVEALQTVFDNLEMSYSAEGGRFRLYFQGDTVASFGVDDVEAWGRYPESGNEDQPRITLKEALDTTR